MADEMYKPLVFLPAALAEKYSDGPFVVIVRRPDELRRWVSDPLPGAQWLQVEQLLRNSEVWTFAGGGDSQIPVDVLLSEPDTEFSYLYRLLDVCGVRDVRVTIPAVPGLLKAIKLATSLRFPVRILPGQPTSPALGELTRTLECYLHDVAVEAPVEFFHSLLSNACGADTGSLWEILEENPAVYLHYDDSGHPRLPRSPDLPLGENRLTTFVEKHLEGLIEQGAECATCPWLPVCRGYFKWPDPAYSCAGVKQLFSLIKTAADEIAQDLVGSEPTTPSKLKLEL